MFDTITPVPAKYAVKYAVKVGRDLWMPFVVSEDHQWVIERFAARDLRLRYSSPYVDPARGGSRSMEDIVRW